MTERNALETELTEMVAKRLIAEWAVLGVAGSLALKPIEDYLRKDFSIEDTSDIVVIVCRKVKP